MTTQHFVYRGVKYTKDGDKQILIKNDRLDKIYRGVHYFKLPKWNHVKCDHVYRGAHYMA
jgi:hypothetical protein